MGGKELMGWASSSSVVLEQPSDTQDSNRAEIEAPDHAENN